MQQLNILITTFGRTIYSYRGAIEVAKTTLGFIIVSIALKLPTSTYYF